MADFNQLVREFRRLPPGVYSGPELVERLNVRSQFPYAQMSLAMRTAFPQLRTASFNESTYLVMNRSGIPSLTQSGDTADILRFPAQYLRALDPGVYSIDEFIQTTGGDASPYSLEEILREVDPTFVLRAGTTEIEVRAGGRLGHPGEVQEESERSREISFERAGELLSNGMIQQYLVVPELQYDVPPGLTKITLIDYIGTERDVIVKLDPVTNEIYPPS